MIEILELFDLTSDLLQEAVSVHVMARCFCSTYRLHDVGQLTRVVLHEDLCPHLEKTCPLASNPDQPRFKCRLTSLKGRCLPFKKKCP